MAYSHRDRRVHRHLWRLLGVAGGGAATLGALAFYGPTVALEVGGLVGLAALGGATIVVGERLVAEYERDLRTVRSGSAPNGPLYPEVRSDVGLDRAVGLPSGRSPHTRRRARTPDGVTHPHAR